MKQKYKYINNYIYGIIFLLIKYYFRVKSIFKILALFFVF